MNRTWLGAVAAGSLAALLASCSTTTTTTTTTQNKNPEEANASQRLAASTTSTRAGLPGWLSDADNATMWNKYCIGDVGDPSVIPRPNYDNDFIKNKVVPKLKQVGDKSYYLYGDVLEVYGLRDAATKKMNKPGYQLPDGISNTGNAFLVYLCGEFRDRATLVEEKLKWLSKLYKLPTTPQKTNIDLGVAPFAQLSATKYFEYINLSEQIFSARRAKSSPNLVDVGGGQKIDPATEGFTVCSVKYMMSEYIAKNKSFSSLDSFESGLNAFSSKCTQDDKDYYYDFRGDSNFKPNSPESNAMIWAGTTMAKMCKNPVTSKDNAGPVKDSHCREYFTKPFESRWNRARQGLMTWMFAPENDWTKFTNVKQLLVLYPNLQSSHGPYGPLKYSYQLGDSSLLSNYSSKFNPNKVNDGDMGFNSAFGLNGSAPTTLDAFKRIQHAVDRHTDWYASGYDDQRGKQMDNSYSPFVASSYELSKSDAFIGCGYTIPCSPNSDTNRQWMFVFKIHKNNWYRTQDLAKGKPVDFSTMWFDETSFGQTDLANGENAFDRLGTALEGEYDSMMYVHNITGNKGSPANTVADDGLPGDDPYEIAKAESQFTPPPQIVVVAPPPPPNQGPQPGPQPAPVPQPPPPQPQVMVEPQIALPASAIKAVTLFFDKPKQIKDLTLQQAIPVLKQRYEQDIKPYVPAGVTLTFPPQNIKFIDKQVAMRVLFTPFIEESDLRELVKISNVKNPNMVNFQK